MNYQFPNSETFLNYLRGRLEGLAHTARFEVSPEMTQEIEKIVGIVIQYVDSNKTPVE